MLSERFAPDPIEKGVLTYTGPLSPCQICNERIKSGDILIPITCNQYAENYTLFVDAVNLVHRKCWEKENE